MKNILIYPAPFIAGILIGFFALDFEKGLAGMLESMPIALVFVAAAVLLATGTKIRPIIFPGEFVAGLGVGFGIRSQTGST